MGIKEIHQNWSEEFIKKLGGTPLKITNLKDINIKNELRETKTKKCPWCGGKQKPLNNNGIIGPGYAAWNYCCTICGRVQID